MRGELVGKGGWDWMFNPIFLSLEILLIDLVLAKTFAIESPNIVGSAVLLLFGLIYKWVDFSSQTKLQVYMISATGLLELAIVSSDFSIDRTLIQSILCVAILVVGVFHISRTRIFMMGDTIRVHGLVGKREFALAKTSVEVREPGISILLRSGELILHEDGEICRASGIYRPELLRRKLIDEGGAIPHFQRASWAGTLWVFLLVLAMIAFIESALFETGWRLEAFLSAAALPGWDPEESPRLQFFAATVDRRLGKIPAFGTPEFPWESDPTTWAELLLTR